jgi:hypothetical protein
MIGVELLGLPRRPQHAIEAKLYITTMARLGACKKVTTNPKIAGWILTRFNRPRGGGVR